MYKTSSKRQFFKNPSALKSARQLFRNPPSNESTDHYLIKGLNIPNVDALCSDVKLNLH